MAEYQRAPMSRWEQRMDAWQGLQSSFDGTIPKSRFDPVTVYHDRFETYAGKQFDVSMVHHYGGQIGIVGLQKLSRLDMYRFLLCASAALEAYLGGGQDDDDLLAIKRKISQ